MLAEYGGAEWADEQAKFQLTSAWVRRKKYEAKLVAAEFGNLFAGTTGGGSERKMAGHELLSMAGITL